MLKRFLKNERGLTLIELLAVVVILGIIAAIAVPSIGGIIEKSKKDAAFGDAIQIISAAKLYAASNKVADDADFTVASHLGPYLDTSKDTLDGTVTVDVGADGNLSYSISGFDNGDYVIASDKTCLESEVLNKTCENLTKKVSTGDEG